MIVSQGFSIANLILLHERVNGAERFVNVIFGGHRLLDPLNAGVGVHHFQSDFIDFIIHRFDFFADGLGFFG